MSDFKPMTECKGFNMERVLLKNKNGYMITAYFKDGMLQCDGDEDWTHPIAWKGFIRLTDLANGVNKTTEQALPIHGVRLSLPHYELYKKLDDKRMKTHVDSEGVWHLYLKQTAEALLDDCDIYEKGNKA